MQYYFKVNNEALNIVRRQDFKTLFQILIPHCGVRYGMRYISMQYYFKVNNEAL